MRRELSLQGFEDLNSRKYMDRFQKNIRECVGRFLKKSYSAFIKAFLTNIKDYLIYKTVEKNRDFLYHPMTTENNSKRSDRALQI